MSYRFYKISNWSALALIVSALLLINSAQAQSHANVSDALVFRTDIVSFTISVTDKKGEQIPGLKRDDFKVYENNVQQEISHFSDADRPTSVGVVFDLSGSMDGERIRKATEALSRFIHTTHPDDEYSLVGFNDQAELLMDSVRDGEALLTRVSSFLPRGNTALYDAVALGLKQVSRGQWQKRALIVISDGDDNRSRMTARQVRRMAEESGVIIYSIIIKDFGPRPIYRLPLEEISIVTGGKGFFPGNGEEMSEAFEQISLELRRLYSVGYTPSDFKTDGKWRKLKVDVNTPEMKRIVIRHRKGYYASNESFRSLGKDLGQSEE